MAARPRFIQFVVVIAAATTGCAGSGSNTANEPAGNAIPTNTRGTGTTVEPSASAVPASGTSTTSARDSATTSGKPTPTSVVGSLTDVRRVVQLIGEGGVTLTLDHTNAIEAPGVVESAVVIDGSNDRFGIETFDDPAEAQTFAARLLNDPTLLSTNDKLAICDTIAIHSIGATESNSQQSNTKVLAIRRALISLGLCQSTGGPPRS